MPCLSAEDISMQEDSPIWAASLERPYILQLTTCRKAVKDFSPLHLMTWDAGDFSSTSVILHHTMTLTTNSTSEASEAQEKHR